MEMLRSVGSDGQLTLSASGDQLNYIDLDMRRARIVVEQRTIHQQAKNVDPWWKCVFWLRFSAI